MAMRVIFASFTVTRDGRQFIIEFEPENEGHRVVAREIASDGETISRLEFGASRQFFPSPGDAKRFISKIIRQERKAGSES